MRRLWTVGAVGLILALALFQLYPAWWSLDHGVVGDWHHPDTISNHWLYRWMTDRLWAGEGFLHNDQYYVPVGDGPWLAGNGSDAVPFALLARVLDWPASLTVWVGLALVLNGVSGVVLARRLGANPAGSTVAGAALGILPYVDVELSGGRFAQMPIYQVVFFLVAWHALLDSAPNEGRAWPDRGTVLRGLLASALFAGASFTYWYHGLWAAMLGATWFAFRPRWRALLPFVPAALLLTLPPLAVFLSGWADIPGAEEQVFPHPIACQSALPPWFPLLGREGFWGPVVLPLVMVIPPLLAVVPSRWLHRVDPEAPASLPWGHKAAAASVVLFWALCLGPYPSWQGGAESGLPGPFLVVYGLASPLRRFWWPYRHVAGLAVALVPLAAVGIDRLLASLIRFAEPRIRPWLAPAAVVLLVATLPADLERRGGIAAAPASEWMAPAAYVALGELPGDVVLELPVTPGRVTGQQTLSYQWVHGKRLLNGHAMWVDRVRPDDWDAWVMRQPLLVGLEAVERGEAIDMDATAASMAGLTEVGLRLVVVNEEYFPGTLAELGQREAALLTALFGAPVLEQDGVSAWDVTTPTGAGPVHVDAARVPALPTGEQGKVPDYGEVDSLGWATLNREVPPRRLAPGEP